MTPHHVTDHLSAYLDDELDDATRSRVDAHLQECAACTATLGELRRIVSVAARVALEDASPDRDLWSGIRGRLEPRGTSDVPAAAHPAPRATSITLSITELAAAAVLLVALSGATAWFVRGGVEDRSSRPAPAAAAAAAVIDAEVEATPSPDAVRPVNFADAQFDAAVADLERALAQRRNDLSPRTVEVLERNLRLIDAAITQARLALDEDPGNSYLNRHLVESRRRKLDLLRRATAIIEVRSQ
jgi:hypothetical protein